jgi:hypothetical protein
VAIDTSQINDPSKMEFKRIEIQKVKDFLSQPRTKFACKFQNFGLDTQNKVNFE